jgi:amidase
MDLLSDLDDIRRLAFVEHGPASLRLVERGPLSDLRFAAKDLIDIAGYKSAWGNPDRLRDAPAAVATAPAALAPLMAGAHLVGKTHTDEIACGMFGMNPHFGTPINPKAPARVPGGSSSGSASAVAAGLCDFALGTDTGGSVRVPASFCGLYGLRTTFGRISVAGIMAMAPSFDTVGWLARDATTLKRVGEVYFGPSGKLPPARLLLARDAFDIPAPGIREALLPAAQSLESSTGMPITEVNLFEEGIAFWLETFRPLQLHDLWSTLGAWGTVPGRRLSPAVAERLDLAATVDPGKLAAAAIRREALTDRLVGWLQSDGVLVLPTAHDLPPWRDAPVAAQVEFREKTLALTCVASLCRLPQINIPAVMVDGCPVGLSLIAGPRGDQRLLDLAAAIGRALPAAASET